MHQSLFGTCKPCPGLCILRSQREWVTLAGGVWSDAGRPHRACVVHPAGRQRLPQGAHLQPGGGVQDAAGPAALGALLLLRLLRLHQRPCGERITLSLVPLLSCAFTLLSPESLR